MSALSVWLPYLRTKIDSVVYPPWQVCLLLSYDIGQESRKAKLVKWMHDAAYTCIPLLEAVTLSYEGIVYNMWSDYNKYCRNRQKYHYHPVHTRLIKRRACLQDHSFLPRNVRTKYPYKNFRVLQEERGLSTRRCPCHYHWSRAISCMYREDWGKISESERRWLVFVSVIWVWSSIQVNIMIFA